MHMPDPTWWLYNRRQWNIQYGFRSLVIFKAYYTHWNYAINTPFYTSIGIFFCMTSSTTSGDILHVLKTCLYGLLLIENTCLYLGCLIVSRSWCVCMSVPLCPPLVYAYNHLCLCLLGWGWPWWCYAIFSQRDGGLSLAKRRPKKLHRCEHSRETETGRRGLNLQQLTKWPAKVRNPECTQKIFTTEKI